MKVQKQSTKILFGITKTRNELSGYHKDQKQPTNILWRKFSGQLKYYIKIMCV